MSCCAGNALAEYSKSDSNHSFVRPGLALPLGRQKPAALDPDAWLLGRKSRPITAKTKKSPWMCDKRLPVSLDAEWCIEMALSIIYGDVNTTKLPLEQIARRFDLCNLVRLKCRSHFCQSSNTKEVSQTDGAADRIAYAFTGKGVGFRGCMQQRPNQRA